MEKKSKINWWTLLAVAVIAIPLGFVGTGTIKKIMQKPDNPKNSDTTKINVPTPERLYLQVNRSDISFTPDRGIDSLIINSNVEWKITKEEGCEWMTITPEGGRDNLPITLTAEKNNNEKRSTTISIQWTDEKGDVQSLDVVVTQEAAMTDKPDLNPVPPIPSEPFLIVTPTSITYATSGGTKSLCIQSNISWTVALSGDDGWLTVNNTNGRGNKTVSLYATTNPSTTEARSATIIVSGTDDEGHSYKKEIHVTQSKSEPLPEPISKDVVQSIVSAGSLDRRVPDGCSVVVNGTKMNYVTFRNKVKKGDYTDIIVQDLGYDSKNVINRVDVKAAVPPPPPPPTTKLTKSQVQALVAKGSSSDGIADNCDITIEGGSTKSYSTFRNEINNYSSITVKDVKFDGENKVNIIKVKAEQKPKPPLTNEEAEIILNSGKPSSKIPGGTDIVINNSETKDYQDFCTMVDVGIYSRIKVNNVVIDNKNKISRVVVTATKNK